MYFLAGSRYKIITRSVIASRRLRGVDAIRAATVRIQKTSAYLVQIINTHVIIIFVSVYASTVSTKCDKLMSHLSENAIKRNSDNNSFFHTMQVLFSIHSIIILNQHTRATK
jgi:type III secretory pathway component EscU